MRLPICLVVLTYVTLLQAQDDQDIRDQYKDVITEIWGSGMKNVTPTVTNPAGPIVLGGQEQCICVPYYNCDPDTNKIIRDGKTDGYGVIDIRFGQQGPVKKCEHYLDICCDDPPEYTGGDDESGPSFGHEKEKPPPPPVGPPVTPPPPVEGPIRCGIRNPKGLEFQITGNNHGESEYAEFPWMTAVLKQHYDYNSAGNDNLAICGGSVIHESVVLTGAHCVDKYVNDVQSIKIRAGDWDTQTARERYPYQERNVREILIHEQYHDKLVYNDIALLILEKPLKYAKNIMPVCLPKQGEIFTQHECYVTGWGKTVFGKKGNPSVILKKIDLPMVDRDTCQYNLRKTRLGKHYQLHKSFICAGGIEGKDACTGDGGGPLVCPKGGQNRYEQAGIVAWGIGCGQRDVPGVYANVALYRNWIDAHMKRMGFGIQSYTQ